MPSPKNLSFDDLLPKEDATTGMSGVEKFRAGMGKAFYDLYRGGKQLFGGMTPEEVDEARRLDAPLMKTGAGVAGNITGNLAAAAPLAVLPGAAIVPGAAAYGAVLGALEPRGTGDSLASNVFRGAAYSAAVPAGIGAAKAGYAVAQPFMKSGRDKIVGGTIKRFAGDDAVNLVKNSQGELVRGSRPTLAEATQDAGIATLQRSAVSSDPLLAKAINDRMMANNEARVKALRSIGGDEGELAFHASARSATAEDLYKKAFSEAPADTKWIKGEVTKLMKRPAFIEALKDGQKIAANEGLRLGKGGKFLEEDSARILHYAKKSLDDKIADSTGNAQRALIDTRDKVVSLLESKDFSPSYREARDTYAKMSVPIDRMKVGKELERRALNNVDDAMGNPTLTPAKFANTLKSGDDVVASATGRRQPLSAVLDTKQSEMLELLRKDLSRLNVAQTAGKPLGSPTAQYLSSQNLMEQIAGPLGIPRSFAQNALTQTMARGADWLYKRAEPRVQQALGEALLDPAEAARIMAIIEQAQRGGLFSRAMPRATPVAGGLLALSPYSTE